MKIYEDRVEVVIENYIKPNLKVIYDLKSRGFRSRDISNTLGISNRDFENALLVFEPLKDVYENATQILAAQLANVVIPRALGIDGAKDNEGRLLPPDYNLAQKLLFKLDPRFKETKEDTSTSIRIEDVIKALRNKKQENTIEIGSTNEPPR